MRTTTIGQSRFVKTPPPTAERDPWSHTVDAAREGSREAIEKLFADLRGYLRSRAAKQLHAGLRAKLAPSDVVQETLIEGYKAFDRFEGQTRGELLVWLQGIMANQLRSARRHYQQTAKRDVRRERRAESGRVDRSGWSPTDTGQRTPSADAIANEEAERLAAALARLPERQEQAIRLRNELRLPFAEVGQVLDCSADAAQKLWSRAIESLSREVRDE